MSQFRVILAMKAYGDIGITLPMSAGKKRGAPYSLVDIAPTVAGILGIEENEYDGHSLFCGTDSCKNTRYVFTESSLNPLVIGSGRLKVLDTLKKGLEFYTINDEGKVIVDPNLYAVALGGKQRSIVDKNFQLALFPDMKNEFIYVRLADNTWFPGSTLDDTDKKHAYLMLRALCKEYAGDTENSALQQCVDIDAFWRAVYEQWVGK